MLILQAVSYSLDTQVNEEQIGEGIDDFGGVNSEIIILCSRGQHRICQELDLNSPSHQLIVEVTGCQYPSSGLGEGYLIWGKVNPIFALNVLVEWQKRTLSPCNICCGDKEWLTSLF